jgi:hypothetical protein
LKTCLSQWLRRCVAKARALRSDGTHASGVL